MDRGDKLFDSRSFLGHTWDKVGFFLKKNERKRDLTWGLRHGEMVSLKDPKGK